MNGLISGFAKVSLLSRVNVLNQHKVRVSRKQHGIRSLSYFEAIIFMMFKSKTKYQRCITVQAKYYSWLKPYGRVCDIIRYMLPVFFAGCFKLLLIDSVVMLRQINVVRIQLDKNIDLSKQVKLTINRNLLSVIDQSISILKLPNIHSLIDLMFYNTLV